MGFTPSGVLDSGPNPVSSLWGEEEMMNSSFLPTPSKSNNPASFDSPRLNLTTELNERTCPDIPDSSRSGEDLQSTSVTFKEENSLSMGTPQDKENTPGVYSNMLQSSHTTPAHNSKTKNDNCPKKVSCG